MNRRPLALLSVLALGLTLAAPVSAEEVTVSLSPTSGGRTLHVEDLAGARLQSLNFDKGGTLPARIRVVDQANDAVGSGFEVSATMTNLYRKTETGHSYDQPIPSDKLAVSYGTTPISAAGVAVSYLPRYVLSGTIPDCTTLSTTSTVLAGLLTDPLAAPLCTTLGTTGAAVAATPVPGATQNLTLPLTDLTDLPASLDLTPEAGAFTLPDYAHGVAVNDPAKTTTAGTSRTVLAGSALITADLRTTLEGTLASLPMVSATGAGTQVAVSSVLTQMQSSADATTSTLGGNIAQLGTVDQQVAVVQALTSALQVPALSDLSGLTGTYVSLPLLQASASAPVAGTYEGTLTVTMLDR